MTNLCCVHQFFVAPHVRSGHTLSRVIWGSAWWDKVEVEQLLHRARLGVASFKWPGVQNLMGSSGSSLANRNALDQRLTLVSWSQVWYWPSQTVSWVPWGYLDQVSDIIPTPKSLWDQKNLASWKDACAATTSFQSSMQAPNLTSVKHTQILDFQTTSIVIWTCET